MNMQQTPAILPHCDCQALRRLVAETIMQYASRLIAAKTIFLIFENFFSDVCITFMYFGPLNFPLFLIMYVFLFSLCITVVQYRKTKLFNHLYLFNWV